MRCVPGSRAARAQKRPIGQAHRGTAAGDPDRRLLASPASLVTPAPPPRTRMTAPAAPTIPAAPADEWFADEAFWTATYPLMFPEARFADAGREVDQVLALARVAPVADRGARGLAALDLACGPGRHSLALAARGFAVTGVDRSAFLLGRAREREAVAAAAAGVPAGAGVEWVHADMRDVVRPGAFDLALCLFTSFGYFTDDADNQRVLDQVAASLTPGGACVVDVAGKEVLARVFRSADVRDLPGVPGGLVVHRRRVVDGWSRLENAWTVIEGGAARTFAFSHWVYSGRELAGMLERAGFVDVRLYGDLAGAPYGAEAGRLVAVGRTPT